MKTVPNSCFQKTSPYDLYCVTSQVKTSIRVLATRLATHQPFNIDEASLETIAAAMVQAAAKGHLCVLTVTDIMLRLTELREQHADVRRLLAQHPSGLRRGGNAAWSEEALSDMMSDSEDSYQTSDFDDDDG